MTNGNFLGAAADHSEAARSPRESRRFANFVVTGGIAAGVNLATRWLLNFAVSYEVAITGAYLVGMATAFLLARRFVFDDSGRRWWDECLRFAIVNLFSFLTVLGVSVGLARLVFPAIGFHRHSEDVAHLIGVLSPVLLSYYAHKHFSFGAKHSHHG